MLAGIDEAGRGCWAGPLVAAAVILNEPIPGLADSKKLSRRQRELLDEQIRASAIAFGIGWVSPQEIDELGLTKATSQAMARAVGGLRVRPTEIIIDGHLNYLPGTPGVRTLVKADALVPAVSAASILAKVARDRSMQAAAKDFPQYYFERHVGYGTALHLSQLQLHGPSVLHRLSYKPVKQFLRVNE